ncbi:MAG TPA: hypothetical protein VGE32_14820 [Cellvibrio sp.]|jgi:hypothetical protein
MWTTDLLEKFFNNNGVSPTAYAFYSTKEDAFSILRDKDLWRIVYMERGVENVLGFAVSESQALNLLKLFVLESERGFK